MHREEFLSLVWLTANGAEGQAFARCGGYSDAGTWGLVDAVADPDVGRCSGALGTSVLWSSVS
ncbi:MAG: hypothetical protein Q4D79_12905 [Propionibacteriaceae bacterium]|nr:hypothetical protein [Propionibacteriaceae bacterium]